MLYTMPHAVYYVSMISAIRFQRRRFLKVLPYMGIAAISVICPQLFRYIWVPLSHEGSICNLTLVCPVALGQKLFEINEIMDQGFC